VKEFATPSIKNKQFMTVMAAKSLVQHFACNQFTGIHATILLPKNEKIIGEIQHLSWIMNSFLTRFHN